jgi:hypothetical protein
MEKNTKVLAEIPKGNELIVVSCGEFKTGKRLDIRTFWSDGESWLPSKKGVSIPMEDVPKLLKGIEKSLTKKPMK